MPGKTIKSIERFLSALVKRYDEVDARREEAIRVNRDLLRHSTNAIFELTRGSCGRGLRELRRARRCLRRALEIVSSVPEEERQHIIRVLGDGLREFVEGALLYQYVCGRKLRGFDLEELSLLNPSSVIEGIFDFIGELRRIFLEKLIGGDVREASKYLEDMREMYNMLARLNIKDYYLPSLKRRLDILRSQIDKSMEDLHVALARGQGR
ncbi:hypothetical protein B6U99_03075 [Candidatus Geothermarchaeota archaeon ex4572_27]|nr:MAG: hypothetical protein B6U99_03075 [Candidatus Geothermarchaeota archaeon ex4572_27]